MQDYSPRRVNGGCNTKSGCGSQIFGTLHMPYAPAFLVITDKRILTCKSPAGTPPSPLVAAVAPRLEMATPLLAAFWSLLTVSMKPAVGVP